VRRSHIMKYGGVGVAAIISLTAMIKTPVLGHVTLVWPSPKLAQSDMKAVMALSPVLPQRSVVLGATDQVVPLALLRPDLKFIAARPDETALVFANAGKPEAGALRVRIQADLTRCHFADHPNVDSEKLLPAMNAILVPQGCDIDGLRRYLQLSSAWVDHVAGDRHVLLRT
jgi:hypothetical protein